MSTYRVHLCQKNIRRSCPVYAESSLNLLVLDLLCSNMFIFFCCLWLLEASTDLVSIISFQFPVEKKKVCQSSLVHSRVEPNTRDHPSKFQNRVIIFKYIKNYYDDNQILIHVLSNLYFIPNSSFRIAQLKILIQVRDSHAILLTEIPLQMSRVSIWNSRLVNLTLVGMEGLNTTESVVMMKEWWLGF